MTRAELERRADRVAAEPVASVDGDGKRGGSKSAPHVRRDTHQGAATPGQRASAAAGNVTEPHLAPTAHRGENPSPSTTSARKRGQRTCRNCGAVGYMTKTCGKTHNVSTSPAPDAGTASGPTSSAARAPATSILTAIGPDRIPSPPPIQLPDPAPLRSPPRPSVARLRSVPAASAPEPSFVEADRREEHLALSALATWRKSHG